MIVILILVFTSCSLTKRARYSHLNKVPVNSEMSLHNSDSTTVQSDTILKLPVIEQYLVSITATNDSIQYANHSRAIEVNEQKPENVSDHTTRVIPKLSIPGLFNASAVVSLTNGSNAGWIILAIILFLIVLIIIIVEILEASILVLLFLLFLLPVVVLILILVGVILLVDSKQHKTNGSSRANKYEKWGRKNHNSNHSSTFQEN